MNERIPMRMTAAIKRVVSTHHAGFLPRASGRGLRLLEEGLHLSQVHRAGYTCQMTPRASRKRLCLQGDSRGNHGRRGSPAMAGNARTDFGCSANQADQLRQ